MGTAARTSKGKGKESMKELKYCKDCINSKLKQGLSLEYCGRHRKFITEFTVINSYTTDRECKDYKPKSRKGAEE